MVVVIGETSREPLTGPTERIVSSISLSMVAESASLILHERVADSFSLIVLGDAVKLSIIGPPGITVTVTPRVTVPAELLAVNV